MITALVLMSLMLIVGLAAVALVDGQTRESGRQRNRESALNLNEGVLYSQAFVLARNWPSAVSYPDCSSATTLALCPDRNSLATANSASAAKANFNSADYLAGATWSTRVRDDGGALTTYYDPATADAAQGACAAPCAQDFNGNHRLWLQVRTSVRERPRSVVALLQLEQFQESFPQNAITAGSVEVTNSGNGTFADITGSQIAVRCVPPPPNSNSGNQCVKYNRPTQISPRTFQQLPASSTSALSASQLDRLRDAAVKAGTFWDGSGSTGCPPNNADLSGAVVWVENCLNSQYGASLQTTPCPSGYPGLSANGGCINTPQAPGVLIWRDGTLKMTGNNTFVGLIHMVNPTNSNGTVFQSGGDFQIYGALSVDGRGGVSLGSNKEPNIKFYPNAFNSLQSFGTAGLVQNTWRELPPGS